MSRLNTRKLHVRFKGAKPDVLVLPRRYTLTHSDSTGDLYLTISSDFDNKQVSGWYTRFMRDEVLAEWKKNQVVSSCLLSFVRRVCFWHYISSRVYISP
jgi:hypothetical protein